MKSKTLIVLSLLIAILIVACSLNNSAENKTQQTSFNSVFEAQNQEPHRYGGWYCPDNLYGFPAVDIANWKNVPVVNGRMANEKDRENGSTLILVDREKYPNANPLDMKMPRLAKFYCHSSKREEIVIVIQALNIQNDSIVGFRFLNGGNGSSRLSKVRFLSDEEIKRIPSGRFATYEMSINSDQKTVSEVMRSPKHTATLQAIFDEDMKMYKSWRKTTNLNYVYHQSGIKNAAYADVLFGNFYVQNDYDTGDYTEKFLLTTNELDSTTTLKITCGPFVDDYEEQQVIIKQWAEKVKELVE